MNTDQLLQTVDRLFALLQERKLEYLLVGGIALLHYIEGRNTEDIDLILSVAALKKLSEIVITSQDTNFARGRFNELAHHLNQTDRAAVDEVLADLQRRLKRFGKRQG